MNTLALHTLSREFQENIVEKELEKTFEHQWEALGRILTKDLQQPDPFYNLVTDEGILKEASPHDELSYVLSTPYFPDVYFEIQPKAFGTSEYGQSYQFAVISTTDRLQNSGVEKFDRELEQFMAVTDSLPSTMKELNQLFTFVQGRHLSYTMDERVTSDLRAKLPKNKYLL